jgi:hypothetical protein
MGWSQAQLDALEKAIASGARIVKYQDGGRTNEVEYRSMADMLDLRRRMREQLGLEDGKRRRKVAQHYNGLG